MSSYTKQMIEVALQWLAVNPDPANPFLTIPGLERSRRRRVDDVTDEQLAAYEREAERRPEMKPQVDELRRLTMSLREEQGDMRDREDLMEHLLHRLFSPGQTKHTTDEHYNTYVGRWCLAWARHGYNVFDLSADFTAAMLLTDARELDIADVRLPFRGLLMLIPDRFARGVEGGHYTRIHLTEVPRSELTELKVAQQIGKIITEAQASGAAPATIKQMLADVERAADNRKSLVVPTYDPDDTAIHIYASDGVHVLETLIERKGLTWDAFDDLPDSVCCDEDKQARHTIRQIVFGALAYISAVETAVEPSRLGGVPRPMKPGTAQRWDVGRTIRLDPKLVRSVRAGSREIALRMKYRHIVRGHYRNQAHGIRRAERRRQWIAPFWKGPEDGAALVHTYKLEDAKEQS